MKKRIETVILIAGLLVFQATVGISQTAPGTFTNPIKGGATLLHFSRASIDAGMTGGRVVYYQCGSMETQLVQNRVLTATLSSSTCDEIPDLRGNITGQWNQWVRVTAGPNTNKYEGLHTATLSLGDPATGALIATLDCRGSIGVGTHRAPLTEAAESCSAPLHFEGTFSGQIVTGPYKGAYLQGTYAGDFTSDPVQGEPGQPVSIVMDGVLLKACPQKFVAGAMPTFGTALKSLKLAPAK